MNRNDQLFFFSVTCAVIAVGVIWAVARFANSVTAAGWVQAIGAIVAIAVGMFVANMQINANTRLELYRQARERRIENLKARALSGRIASLLIDIQNAAKRCKKIAESVQAAYDNPSATVPDTLELLYLAVRIPDNIYVDLWTLPQTSFLQISHTLYTVEQYDRWLRDAAPIARRIGSASIVQLAEAAIQRMQQIDAEVEKAYPHISGLVDPK